MGGREFNGVKVERVSAWYVFLEAAAFKLGVDRWETFLTYGNARKRNEYKKRKVGESWVNVNIGRDPLWMCWGDLKKKEGKLLPGHGGF